jgi:hypothetical protein
MGSGHTKKWMARSGDTHVPFDEAKRRIYVDPAAARARWSPHNAKSAALKGRPADLPGSTGAAGTR